jgi:hypothetical protein
LCYTASMTHHEDELGAVVERNRLRRQASLPLLDVDAELRRLKAARDQAELASYVRSERHRFTHLLAGRVGWAAQGPCAEIRRRLRQEWLKSRNSTG